jgi:hypothetical protein
MPEVQPEGTDIARALLGASAADLDEQSDSLQTLSTTVAAQLEDSIITEAGTQT